MEAFRELTPAPEGLLDSEPLSLLGKVWIEITAGEVRSLFISGGDFTYKDLGLGWRVSVGGGGTVGRKGRKDRGRWGNRGNRSDGHGKGRSRHRRILEGYRGRIKDWEI